MTLESKITRLELMRKPFEPHQISKLPKQVKWMTEAKDQYTNCKICGGYHHPKAVHLDYVGHAALTDRLLDVDPFWSWEPMAYTENGAPAFDKYGGLWIKLTVCDITRPGYGHPDNKTGGDANKEAIGDALRNAAMRFGAALDLWHKGDLHAVEDKPEEPVAQKPAPPKEKTEAEKLTLARQKFEQIKLEWAGFRTSDQLNEWALANKEIVNRLVSYDELDREYGKAFNDRYAELMN